MANLDLYTIGTEELVSELEKRSNGLFVVMLPKMSKTKEPIETDFSHAYWAAGSIQRLVGAIEFAALKIKMRIVINAKDEEFDH